jgi:3-deoxy-D-manno-octulosonic-acid transferase
MRHRTARPGLGHWVYRLAAYALTLPALLLLVLRSAKEPGYRFDLAERLGAIQPNPSVRGGLWVHVASVGEAQAGLTLLNELQASWGTESLVWTTQTPAAKNLLTERLPAGAQIFFAPLDQAGAVKRFLRHAQPRALLLLERELWPEWLWQCERQAVEVTVANARMRAASVDRWPYGSHWMRQRLRSLRLVLCADSASADHFRRLGLEPERIHTLGNLKFDQTLSTAFNGALKGTSKLDIPAALAHRTVIVAASTHEGDEEALMPGWPGFLDTWQEVAPAHAPKPLLVLAPRHPKRFGEVARQLQQQLGLQAGKTLAIRSEGHAVNADTQIWLLDSIGELAQVYSSARLCLMGGTWAPVGGHNALEPLSVGCPVVFGPNTHQFPDLYNQMVDAHCAKRVSASALWQSATEIATDDVSHAEMQRAAHRFVTNQQGSAQRSLQALRVLPSWPKQPMPPIRSVGSEANGWWLAADVAADPSTDMSNEALSCQLDSILHSPQIVNLAAGSGRGQAYRVEYQGLQWVLRHYRRGGWMARLAQDTYPPTPTARSRAMQELVLLRTMHSMGLPVPAPVAAHYQRTHALMGRFSRYRADIAMEWLPNTRNLVQTLRERALTAHEWEAVGQAIAALHRHQIFHADLNAHNLLLDTQGQVFVVDFDKCKRRGGDEWKARNLARLKRSLIKEHHRQALYWQEAKDWTSLLNAYDANP